MANMPLSKEDGERFRRRVEYEDDLLNTRMNIILTMNGLAAVAVGLSLPAPARLIVAIIMIIADASWIPRALEASRFIGALTQRLKESRDTAPSDEVFRWEIVHRPRRVGTTKFMAVVIPSLLLAGWIVAVLYALFGS
jgi:hypothetical protein